MLTNIDLKDISKNSVIFKASQFIHVYIDTGALGYNLTSSTVQLGYLYDLLFISVMNCMKYFC